MPDWKRDQNQDDDWAKQVPWERSRGPYRDYGWEKGQSELPEFRDPSNRVQPYERDRVSRWRKVNWDEDRNRGEMDQGGPFAGMGPKGYQPSDQRIFEDVCERLTRHGRIDARGMQVEVKDGEVTLTGTINNREAKRMSEMVAESVNGVKDVHNQLRVQDQGMGRQSTGGGQGTEQPTGQRQDRK